MKTLLLAALFVGVAFATSYKEDIDVFRAGKEYNFQLRSQVANGVPHIASQYSGLQTTARARLQIQYRNRAVLQLEDVEVKWMNSKLPRHPVNEFINDQQIWQQLPQDQQTAIKECFKQPINFRYEEGIVSELAVASEQPEWCTNMMKGVVSLLQVDSKQHNQLEDVSPSLAQIVQQNTFSWDKSYNKAYRVMEEGIDGECESLYVIRENQHQQQQHEEDEWRLMKVRNHDNCKRRPIYTEGVLTSYFVDPDNQQNISMVESFNINDYRLKGDRSNFVIKSLRQLSKQVLTPTSQENGEVAAFTVQELTLQQVKDSVDVIQPPRNTRPCPEGLLMKYQEQVDEEEDELIWYYQRDQESKQEQTQVIDELLSEYLTKCTPIVTEEASKILKKLAFHLRISSVKEIMSVVKTLKTQQQQSNNQQKLKVLLDLIPTIGQSKVVTILHQLLEKNYVENPQDVATMFNMFALTARPSIKAVRQLLPQGKLFQLRQVENTPQLRRVILLTLGTMYRNLYQQQKYLPYSTTPSQEFRTLTNDFVQQIRSLFEKYDRESEVDRRTVLGCIGNSGLPDLYQLLERVISDESNKYPQSVRISAIFATRHMPQQMMRKIHNLLLSIYESQHQPQSIRSVAYMEMIQSNPSYAVVQAIVNNLIDERSVKVGRFVYSHLLDVAESERLSYRQVREHVRQVIKQAPRILSDKFYSNTYSLDVLSRELGIGQYLDLYIIDSTKTDSPYGLYGGIGSTLFGREINVMQGGGYLSGVEEILSRLVGPKSIFREKELTKEGSQLVKDVIEVIKEVLQPEKPVDMGKVKETIQDIVEKLGLESRPDEEFEYRGYLMVLSNELRHFRINPRDILKFIEENEHPSIETLQKIIELLKDGYRMNYINSMAAQTSLMIPTAVGIPLYFNTTYRHTVRVTGSLQLRGNPLSLINGKEPVTLQTELRPSANVEIWSQIGLQIPALRSGVEVRSRVFVQSPIPCSFSYNHQKQTINAQCSGPEQKMNLVEAELTPYTFIQEMKRESEKKAYISNEKQITNRRLVRPIQMNIPYKSEMFGYTVENTYELPKHIVGFTPAFPLSGRYSYTCTVNPITNDKKFVELILKRSSKSSQLKESYESVNYRSYSRDQEDSLEEKSRQLFEDVKIRSLFQNPKDSSYILTLSTKNTPHKIDITSKLTYVWDQYLNKFQVCFQAHDETTREKYSTDMLLNIKNMPSQQKTRQDEETIVSFDVTYSKGSQPEQTFTININRGDRQAKLEVPVEPNYINIMRRAFRMDEITVKQQPQLSQYEEESDSTWGWLFGSQSGQQSVYGEQNDQSSYHKAVLPLDDIPFPVLKYNIEIDYSRTSQPWQEYVQSVAEYIRTRYMKYGAYTSGHHNQQGKINIFLRYFKNVEQMHLLVTAPQSELVFYMPVHLTKHNMRSLTFDLNKEKKYEHLLMSTSEEYQKEEQEQEDDKKQKSGECVIREKKGEEYITTYDQFTYKLPSRMSECEMVVTQDCSESRLFTVLLSNKNNKKTLRVLIPNNELEIVYDGHSATLMENGKQISLRDNVPAVLKLNTGKKTIEVTVEKKGELVSCITRNLGLEITMSQKDIRIRSSRLSSGHLCGACGDYNGDVVRELTGPRQQLYKNAQQMALSYVVPSQQCNVDSLRSQLDLPEGIFKCEKPYQRNIFMRYEYSMCVSIRPQPVCSLLCKPDEERRERVEFHCYGLDSQEAKRLQEEGKRRPLYEMATKEVDRTMEVELPESCRPRW